MGPTATRFISANLPWTKHGFEQLLPALEGALRPLVESSQSLGFSLVIIAIMIASQSGQGLSIHPFSIRPPLVGNSTTPPLNQNSPLAFKTPFLSKN
jgi:hypothetical protein